MSNTQIPQIGEAKNGYVLTENGWTPTRPPKKKRTFLKVFLALCAFGIVSVIAIVALLASAANEVSNSIEADANKPGGTDNPMAITEGKPFAVDGFKYAAGWQIAHDGLGDATVKDLKVTNDRDSKDSALVEIKLWKGTEVKTLVDCTTSPIDVGSTVTLSCLSTDPMPKHFDKVTINDSF
ncbi:MAG TPA: hypothetical protein VEX15_12060 [Nocardioidaceae bacterium]|nr:hypothetical protein [Nocardioidaceae bacterium]